MSLHAFDAPDPAEPAEPAADGRASAACRSNETPAERAARHAARRALLERARATLGGNDARWLEECIDAIRESFAESLGRALAAADERVVDDEAVGSAPDAGDTRVAAEEAAAASDALDLRAEAPAVRTFDLAFGLAPRRLGREPLVADGRERESFRAEAASLMRGWRPERLRVDEATRVLLLTAAGDGVAPRLFARALRHADLTEQLALYRGLPLLPPARLVAEGARHGLRGNVPAVFEAIAHESPWPARHLDEDAWNQLVLKALFIDSALAPIHDLDARANPTLAAMLIDYARERRAARRPIPLELWRALGPHATREALAPFLPEPDAPADAWPGGAEGEAIARAAEASRDAALLAYVRARRPAAREAGAFGWGGVPGSADDGPADDLHAPSHDRSPTDR